MGFIDWNYFKTLVYSKYDALKEWISNGLPKTFYSRHFWTCIGFIVVVAVDLFLFSLGENLFNNGDGADKVRDQLDRAVENQQRAVTDIREAEDTASKLGQSVTDSRHSVENGRTAVEDSRKSVSAASESNEELRKGNDRAAELIRDCQEVLRGVRERGAEKAE